MAESPFAYYRGTPRSWPSTSRRRRRTDIIVQASGDAHLSNFGLFASPERTLVFDANDFDETLPAPWEWDVKRLAASIVIAAAPTASAPPTRAATWPRCAAYREWMARYAGMRLIDVWYSDITEPTSRRAAPSAGGRHRAGHGEGRARPARRPFAKARGKDR